MVTDLWRVVPTLSRMRLLCIFFITLVTTACVGGGEAQDPLTETTPAELIPLAFANNPPGDDTPTTAADQSSTTTVEISIDALPAQPAQVTAGQESAAIAAPSTTTATTEAPASTAATIRASAAPTVTETVATTRPTIRASTSTTAAARSSTTTTTRPSTTTTTASTTTTTEATTTTFDFDHPWAFFEYRGGIANWTTARSCGGAVLQTGHIPPHADRVMWRLVPQDPTGERQPVAEEVSYGWMADGAPC